MKVVHFDDVFGAIPDVMGIQDTERRVIRDNTAGYACLGVKPEEAIGRHGFTADQEGSIIVNIRKLKDHSGVDIH